MNFSLSVEAAADDQQDHRQHHDEHADDERPQPRAGLAAATRARSRRRGTAPPTPIASPTTRADHLIGRAARGRALLLQFVGDLGLELGQDVRLSASVSARSGRLVSRSVTVASALVAEADAVLLDQVGVALRVLSSWVTTSSPEISIGVRLFCLLNSL